MVQLVELPPLCEKVAELHPALGQFWLDFACSLHACSVFLDTQVTSHRKTCMLGSLVIKLSHGMSEKVTGCLSLLAPVKKACCG